MKGQNSKNETTNMAIYGCLSLIIDIDSKLTAKYIYMTHFKV